MGDWLSQTLVAMGFSPIQAQAASDAGITTVEAAVAAIIDGTLTQPVQDAGVMLQELATGAPPPPADVIAGQMTGTFTPLPPVPLPFEHPWIRKGKRSSVGHEEEEEEELSPDLATGLIQEDHGIVVDLSRKSLTTSHARSIGALIKRSSAVKRVDVSGNHCLCDEGVSLIVHALHTPGVVLQMSDTHAGTGSAFALAHAIAGGFVSVVELVDNDIGDEGVVAICAAMTSQQCQLRRLSLCNNKIGLMGAKALAQGLIETECLKQLYLDGCGLGDDGVGVLAHALARNRTLQSLGLGRNRITGEGCSCVATALKRNRTIRTIFMSGNRLGFRGAWELAVVMRRNRVLKGLYLVNSPDVPDDIKHDVRVAGGERVNIS